MCLYQEHIDLDKPLFIVCIKWPPALDEYINIIMHNHRKIVEYASAHSKATFTVFIHATLEWTAAGGWMLGLGLWGLASLMVGTWMYNQKLTAILFITAISALPNSIAALIRWDTLSITAPPLRAGTRYRNNIIVWEWNYASIKK